MFGAYMELLENAYKVDRGYTRERNKETRSTDVGFGLSDHKFIKTYRLTKTLARDLIEDLRPHIAANLRNDGIDVETKVLATIAFFAVGSYQTMVGDVKVHSMSQPAVSRAIKEVANAFNQPDILNKYIKFPLTRIERDTVKEDFYAKYGFPGVLGCIDGTHVAIVCPKDHEERYFCRKQYHSLNCMIICDANMQIMAVDSSHPGSMHDAKVWEDNPLRPYLQHVAATTGELVYLLGDSGYSLRKSMMIPIVGASEGTPEAHYYKKHVQTRNVVERCIGALKTRFREGNHPDDYSRITYKNLMDLVCQCANALRDSGVGKGDRVSIYMPMILETIICMLACARIGAIHSVVFAGFSSDSLAERMADCKAKVLVTADGAWRGEKLLLLKNTCNEALDKAKSKHNHTVEHCIVVSHLGRVTPCGSLPEDIKSLYMWDDDRDIWWHDLLDGQSTICPPEWMDAEDPLFMLYTSGSTGKPKGVLHTTAGYLLYATATFRYVFDYCDKDVYWCTADVGWITGHTYVVYAPLANAATSVIFEGTPFYPDNDRYWALVDKYKVTQFYTAPTAIRSLTKFGDDYVKMHNLSTLRVLGSVGEPINPEAWLWYYRLVGSGRCSIVDTFWQTETGGHVLTSLPGATPMKPGAAGFPFFGVEPQLLDDNGQVVRGAGEGYLVFARPWPGLMRTLYGDHDRYESVYFTKFPGYYCTGDGARRDEDGFLWVTGRVDDMLNVSGHLMSTAEVEGVLTEEPRVSEAAVVSKPHPIKGESLYCFVILNDGAVFDENLKNSLKKLVRQKIGAFATPDVIQYAPGLPKTRSGKIMRRILRKVALGDHDIGDTSTLADPSVVDELFKNRP